MPNELWMIYDKTGLDRNSTFVEMFAERGKPYNIDVKAVLDTEYLSLLKKGIQPCAVLVRAICPSINAEFGKRKIPVWNSSFVSGICNHKGKTREYLKDTVFCTPTVSCNSDKVNEILGYSAEEVRQYLLENMDFSSKFNEQEKKRSLFVPKRSCQTKKGTERDGLCYPAHASCRKREQRYACLCIERSDLCCHTAAL